MPRNVRNFWIEVTPEDGKTTATGPRSKDGGFTADIRLRHKGEVSNAVVRITGRVNHEGEINLTVHFDPGDTIYLETGDAPRLLWETKQLGPNGFRVIAQR